MIDFTVPGFLYIATKLVLVIHWLALMKTLARNEEKRKQEQETRNVRYAHGLRVQESVGIRSVSSSCTKLTYYLNRAL